MGLGQGADDIAWPTDRREILKAYQDGLLPARTKVLWRNVAKRNCNHCHGRGYTSFLVMGDGERKPVPCACFRRAAFAVLDGVEVEIQLPEGVKFAGKEKPKIAGDSGGGA